jgi:nitrate/nitrite transporter NarK
VQVFAVFALGYMLSQFFRSFLAVIAPELQRELGLTASDLGNMGAAWFAVFALAQFPIGAALDRFGPRLTTALGMLAAVTGSVLFSMAESAPACLLAMALIGLGSSPIFIGALYYFGRVHEPGRFGLLSSWLIAIGTLGNLIAATPLAAAVAAVGWRATFLAIAALVAAVAALVAMLVTDPPRAEQKPGGGGIRAGLAEILAIRALRPILPMVFLSYAVVASERGLWIGPYFADVHGLGPIERGNAALWMAAAMSAGAFLYGPLEAALDRRKWLVVAGSLVAVAGFLALGLLARPSPGAAMALLTLIGAAGMTYSVIMAHGRQFFPAHVLGRGITFLNFVFMSGVGLVQLASGRAVHGLAGAGWSAADIYAALHLGFGLALLAVTLLYAGARDPRTAQAAQKR